MLVRVDQPAGIGDIIFIQKIIYNLLAGGDTVHLPVIRQYEWLAHYIKLDGLFIGHSPWESAQIIPLASSGNFYPGMSVMAAKYEMMHMDYTNWQHYVHLHRNHSKERELEKRLGVFGRSGYRVVSTNIQSPPDTKSIDIEIRPDDVVIRPIDGFTAFDWSSVISHAGSISIVDSCWTWLIDIIDVQATEFNLYSRNHGKPGVHTSLSTLHMFRRPWKVVPQY